MALTALVATAVAAAAGLAAVDTRWPLVAVLFALVLVTRPDRSMARRRVDTRLLVWVTGVAGVLVYLWSPDPDQQRALAASALVLGGALALLWPAPILLRSALVISAATLALADLGLREAAGPIVGFGAGSAVALIALRRLSTTAVPALAPGAPSPVRPRRVGAEAITLFALATLAGLLVASLLPPPDGAGRGPGPRGRGGRGGELPPYLTLEEALDAGGRGTGKGNEVVFEVKASAAALWRTMTFDAYDGREWARSPRFDPGEADDVLKGPKLSVPPGVGDVVATHGPRLVQKVTVRTDFINVLPAAARPASVELRDASALTTADGVIVAVPILERGDRYTVTSQRAPSPVGAAAGPVPLDIAGTYLDFPALPARVGGLAAQVTAGADTAFDQATAIERWVRENTTVRPGAPALAPGADPVDQFLFVDRAGSNEQAASAMAVLLRTLGIPARLAVGYLPGRQATFGGEYVVRARDAHAWVEVWFPGVGWAAFDPAGRFAGPSEAETSLAKRLGLFWWFLLLAALVAIAVVAYLLYGRWRRRRARPWATRCYERLVRAGNRRGRPHQPHETPAEYCAALAAHVPDERLLDVGQLLTVAAYARREPPADDRTWADDVVAATERSAPRRSRPSLPGIRVPPR